LGDSRGRRPRYLWALRLGVSAWQYSGCPMICHANRAKNAKNAAMQKVRQLARLSVTRADANLRRVSRLSGAYFKCANEGEDQR
jgi:hypothetical protein